MRALLIGAVSSCAGILLALLLARAFGLRDAYFYWLIYVLPPVGFLLVFRDRFNLP